MNKSRALKVSLSLWLIASCQVRPVPVASQSPIIPTSPSENPLGASSPETLVSITPVPVSTPFPSNSSLPLPVQPLPEGTVEIKSVFRNQSYFCELLPPDPKLSFPTDIAVSPDGNTIYAISTGCRSYLNSLSWNDAWASIISVKNYLPECSNQEHKGFNWLKQNVIFKLSQNQAPELLLKNSSTYMSCTLGRDLEVDKEGAVYFVNDIEARIERMVPGFEPSPLLEIREKSLAAAVPGFDVPTLYPFTSPQRLQIHQENIYFSLYAGSSYPDYRLRKLDFKTKNQLDLLKQTHQFDVTGNYNYTIFENKVYIFLAPGSGGTPFSDRQFGLVEYHTLPAELSLISGNKNAKMITVEQQPGLVMHPHELRAGPSGVMYLSDVRNHLIWTISLNADHTKATMRILAGSGQLGYKDGTGSNASFNVPTALSLDAAGNLYVSDTANHAIRKVTPTGVVTTFYKTPNS